MYSARGAERQSVQQLWQLVRRATLGKLLNLSEPVLVTWTMGILAS